MVVILTSQNMPRVYAKRLESLIKDFKFIYILTIKPTVDFSLNSLYRKYIRSDIEKLCTIKLDDDDALNPKICKMISEHVNKLGKYGKLTLLTFPNGCCFDYNSKHCIKYKCKLIACGLTLISSPKEEYNIFHEPYAKLNYERSGKMMGKIIDETNSMYLIVNHNANHSLRGKWMRMAGSKEDFHLVFPQIVV